MSKNDTEMNMQDLVGRLEESSQELDDVVLERLAQGRREALRAIPEQPRSRFTLFPFAGAGALAISMVVALVYFDSKTLTDESDTPSPDVAAFELLADDDLLDLLQDELDFYEFADEQIGRS